jgi:uncharacterized protein (TIGR00255 family)
MRSMTGYGGGSSALADGRVVVEVRSVNARSLDVRTRCAEPLGEASLWAEQLVKKRLRRGRVEISIRCEGGAAASLGFDHARAVAAMRSFQAVADELMTREVSLTLLAAVPGLFASAPIDASKSRAAATDALGLALDALDEDRAREGAAIASELRERASTVGAALERARARAALVPGAFKARLLERLSRLDLAAAGSSIDPGRLEAEVALCADRCDVAEELSRLGTHLAQIQHLVERASAGPATGDPRAEPSEPEGRRLDFLLQEALREATTLSAKAQDAEISTLVVDIKVELERMREQVQNVE